MATIIHQCTCKNTYQDKKYGKGMRVHNEGKSKTPGGELWRCTVCESEKGK